MVVPDLGEIADEELLKRWTSAGEQAAFSSLLDRHQQRVYALSYKLMGNEADALDAVQETFLKVMLKGKLFKGQSAFSTWLFRITTNVCNDMLRKKSRTAIPQDVMPSQPGSDLSGVADRLTVMSALRELPSDQRAVIVLRDLCDLPYSEIAGALGVQEGTVKSRIARARVQLAKLLSELEDAEPRLKERDR